MSDPQDHIRWEGTVELYTTVMKQLADFPSVDALEDEVLARLPPVWKKTGCPPPPSEDFIDHFLEVIHYLYGLEDYHFTVKPFPPAIIGTLQGARYRDQLLALNRRFSDPKRTPEALITGALDLIGKYLSALPKAAFAKPSQSLLTVPLVDHVSNLPQLVAAIIATFTERSETFPNILAKLNANIQAISPKADRPVTPLQFNGTPGELVHAFFKDTPLHKLFDLTIPFDLPNETRFSGHWIVAPPNRGKSNLLRHMVLRDIERDACVIVMDSKGELIAPLKELRSIKDRMVLLEPTADNPLALNPLDIPRLNFVHTISFLEYIFAALLESKMTALQSDLFRSVLRAIVETVPTPTLETFRRVIVQGPEGILDLSKLDPELQQFFHNDFKKHETTRDSLKWRLRALMDNPATRPIFSAVKTRIDMGHLMDTKRVILIDNSKARLTDTGCEFLSRFFLALIQAAGIQRTVIPEDQRVPCYVYIDECQNVISRDPILPKILDELRSAKIAMILSHQRTAQIDDPNVKDALYNCAIRMTNSDDEAKLLAEKFRTDPETLRGLPIGTFATFIRDVTRHAPLLLQIPYVDPKTLPRMTTEEQRALRDQMRAQFSFTPQSPQPSAPPPPLAPPFSPAHSTPETMPQTPQTIASTEIGIATSVATPIQELPAKQPEKPLKKNDASEPSSDW